MKKMFWYLTAVVLIGVMVLGLATPWLTDYQNLYLFCCFSAIMNVAYLLIEFIKNLKNQSVILKILVVGGVIGFCVLASAALTALVAILVFAMFFMMFWDFMRVSGK